MTTIFKVQAYDDTLYIRAANKDEARNRLLEFTGYIPDNLLTWTEVTEIPEGEEFL